MWAESQKGPKSFTAPGLLAECRESATGERWIAVHHPETRVWDQKTAVLRNEHTAARFAAWLVRAAEWVHAAQPLRSVCGKGKDK